MDVYDAVAWSDTIPVGEQSLEPDKKAAVFSGFINEQFMNERIVNRC